MQHPADALTGGSHVTASQIRDERDDRPDEGHVDAHRAPAELGRGQISFNVLQFVKIKTSLTAPVALPAGQTGPSRDIDLEMVGSNQTEGHIWDSRAELNSVACKLPKFQEESIPRVS